MNAMFTLGGNAVNNTLFTLMEAFNAGTILEREQFIVRACAELICSMCDEKDAKGLEVLHNNLSTLINFTEDMQNEVEVKVKKEKIQQEFAAICADVEAKDFSTDIADRLAGLSEAVREYALEQLSADGLDDADEIAYENIKAVMEREASAIEA